MEAAISAQMWPEAMLIASFTDKDEYKVGSNSKFRVAFVSLTF